MVHHTPTDRLTATDDRGDWTVYRDDRSGTYHAWFDLDRPEPVSTTVPRAVASVQETDPIDLEPLNERVDADALDALFAPNGDDDAPRTDGSIEFAYAGCAVTVHSWGEIVVEPLLD